MGKRGQSSRKASGKKPGSKTRGDPNRQGTETGAAQQEKIPPEPEGKEGSRKNPKPIEVIFQEEVGRELEPEEREILLGIHRKRRKSKGGPRNRPSSRNR